jgi:hypothetical protein
MCHYHKPSAAPLLLLPQKGHFIIHKEDSTDIALARIQKPCSSRKKSYTLPAQRASYFDDIAIPLNGRLLISNLSSSHALTSTRTLHSRPAY